MNRSRYQPGDPALGCSMYRHGDSNPGSIPSRGWLLGADER